MPRVRDGRRAPDPPARSGERGEVVPSADGRGDSRPRDAAPVWRGELAGVGRERSGHIPGAFCIGPRPDALVACAYPIEDRVLARRGFLSCSGASHPPSVAVAGPHSIRGCLRIAPRRARSKPGGLVVARSRRIQRSCPAFGSGCVPATRVPPLTSSSMPSARCDTILRYAFERQRPGGRSPPPSRSACAIPLVSRISWHLGRRPIHPGACGVPMPRHASRCPAHTSFPWTVQRPFHPTLRVARRCSSPVEMRGWVDRRQKLSGWPGGKRPRYRRGLRYPG